MAKKKHKSYSKRSYYKPKRRRYRNNRDYLSPEYTKWREDIKKRDNYQCQWPGCLSNVNIQIHHIKTWSKYPGLRYATANGITLCKTCHESIKGKEEDFESFFFKLLEWQMIDKIKEFEKRKR